MEQFMMPPGGPQPGEVPPAVVAAPQPDVMLQPQVQEQVAKQGLLQDEGAQGPSQAGDGFFDKLRTDPKMAQSMLMVGLRMMQGQRPGQDTMGMIGDAMMAGAAAHNMLKYNEGENARKDTELGLKVQESGARVAQANASTAATQQATQQSAAQFPNMQAKLAQEVKNLRTQGKTAEANSLIQEAKAGNIKTELDLENAARRANISQSNAAAGASAAQARYADAGTQGRILENEARLTLIDRNATPEDQEGATRVLNNGKSDKTVVKSQQNALKELIKEANPDWTPAQVAQEALNMGQTAKTNYLNVAQKVIDNPDGYSADVVAAAKQVVSGSLQDQAKRGQPGKVASPTGSGVEYRLKPGADPKLRSSYEVIQK